MFRFGIVFVIIALSTIVGDTLKSLMLIALGIWAIAVLREDSSPGSRLFNGGIIVTGLGAIMTGVAQLADASAVESFSTVVMLVGLVFAIAMLIKMSFGIHRKHAANR